MVGSPLLPSDSRTSPGSRASAADQAAYGRAGALRHRADQTTDRVREQHAAKQHGDAPHGDAV